MITYIALFVAVVFVLILWVRSIAPVLPELEIIETDALRSTPPGDEITVMIWNLGYASLGAGSDFITDGGKSLRGPSRAIVQKNLDNETAFIANANYDVFLLQELARASWETHGIDSVAGIQGVSPGWFAFSADIIARYLPPPFRLRHGPGLLSHFRPESSATFDLPLDDVRVGGVIQRNYHTQIMRFAPDDRGRAWTVINIHLAAFDDGANARREQLEVVFELAQAEAATGAAVIIGGDWNLRLTETDFPHTTLEEHLFWVHDFPMEYLPAGWQIIADPATPTVRSSERSYTRGENYTTIIDGFIVSPGVELIEVSTTDLDFQPADHHPVRARFRHGTAAPRIE